MHLKPVEMQMHNTSLYELATLATITAYLKPKRVVEIGTYDGRSTLAIAANAPDGEVLTSQPASHFLGKPPASNLR